MVRQENRQPHVAMDVEACHYAPWCYEHLLACSLSLFSTHVPALAQTILDLFMPFRTCSAMMSLRCHRCSTAFHHCSICFLFRILPLTVAPQRHHRFALVWFSDLVYKSLQLAHVTPDLFWLNHQLKSTHFTIYRNS